MSALKVDDLVKEFRLRDGRARRTLRAVDGVSLELVAGKTVALVGESGSGKSTVARILARLIKPTSGDLLLDGEVVGTSGRALSRYREEVQIVFQDPFASLNPFHSIDHHLRRPLRLHRNLSRADEDAEVLRLLERVNLTPAATVAGKRPSELSGGQRQRIAIARALAPQPSVLLADEPVSMLDVSVRLEILNLIAGLQAEDDLAVLYITHDLATARHFSTSILVMYRGEVVESGPSDEVILHPKHPYTQLLASAAPDPRARLAGRQVGHAGGRGGGALSVAPPPEVVAGPGGAAGTATTGDTRDVGCRFRDRCPSRMPVCEKRPPAFAVGPEQTARCWLYEDGAH